MYNHSLFLFRRDLRDLDNTGLNEASRLSRKVTCAFIFDPRQCDHPYFSNHAFQFMLESLEGLKIPLTIIQGNPKEIIKNLKGIDAVFVNRDYTPFANLRDKEIQTICEKRNISFHSYADYLLLEPEMALKKDNTPYTKFTPFYRNASQFPIKKPDTYTPKNLKAGKGTLPTIRRKELLIKGGRKNGLRLLRNIPTEYEKNRNMPAKKTSLLSAHHKFGTISIRESYWQKTPETFTQELYWRDFFTHIAYHFPYVFGKEFQKKFQDIKWKKDKNLFRRWCQGKTGFPIVDAGMRELNETGYMHNRVRMITASFLVKDLHIDWQWGEQYFATKLIDYDPSVNNGNWQWAASTGCDAQPYFRIFNPWRQQERFDPDCIYIKRFIPELANFTSKKIHHNKDNPIKSYQDPILDHKEAKNTTLSLFNSLKQDL
ncbi:MAG: cryptochrome/photolyase family protein [Candidatus Woesearchaeota archaeon]